MKQLHLSATLFVTLTLSSHAGIISAFGSGNEGWSGLTADPYQNGAPVVQGGLTAVHSPTSGNPGGYISLADPDSNDTFFLAPATYLGNRLSSLNGSLRYDIYTDSSGDYAGPNIVLRGGGLTLIYFLPTQPAQQDTWVTVTIPLAPGANWYLGQANGASPTQSDFQTVLASLTGLLISAENHNGITETTRLDNVDLSDPGSPIPEPPGWVMGLIGFGFVFWYCRSHGNLRTN